MKKLYTAEEAAEIRRRREETNARVSKKAKDIKLRMDDLIQKRELENNIKEVFS